MIVLFALCLNKGSQRIINSDQYSMGLIFKFVQSEIAGLLVTAVYNLAARNVIKLRFLKIAIENRLGSIDKF